MADLHYDYLILGSGPAGHVSAICASQLGLKVAVVEKDRDMFGGVCLNEGCIPAKSLYHSAEMLDIALRSGGMYGLEVKGSPDMLQIVKKSRETRDLLSGGLSFLLEKNHVDTIYGTASFENKGSVRIVTSKGDISVVSDKFLIATGSHPEALAGLPFDGKKIISSSEAIRLDRVPKNILIIGAGAIGVEFASFFGILGSKVTLAEKEETILPLEDKEIGRRMNVILKKRGIDVITGRPVTDLKGYEKVIIAAGRAPSTKNIGLDKAGVEIDEKGYVKVGDDMKTNADNIYAAGDVINTPMLAHVAYIEGEIAARSAAGEKPEPIDYRAIPSAVYSQVKAASVGLTEEKAREANIEHKIGKQFFKANGRAVANGESEGFIKVIAEVSTRKLIGAHILGRTADEIIHEFALAIRCGLTVDDIAGTVHAHPTFSETAADAARSVFGRSIHG